MNTHRQNAPCWSIPLWSLLAALTLVPPSALTATDVKLRLLGASSVSREIGNDDLTPPSHFLSQARTFYDHTMDISGFRQLAAYREVYPGVNMTCYGDDHHFEYAFLLRTGADPSQIKLQLKNAKTEGLTQQGDIVYKGEGFEAYQHAPVAFQFTTDGKKRAVPSRLAMDLKGATSIATPGHDDEHREALNETRFNIVTANPGDFGPNYDFYMSKYETTNEQLIRFLNNAEANRGNPRGENMFFDENGGAWINPVMQPGRDEMFRIDAAKIEYDPERVAGDRYHHVMDAHGREPFANHPATGISWLGAIKYCNWLTLQAGRTPEDRCYREGTNRLDWAPATATNWPEGLFSTKERAAWLALKGFRLPMYRTFDRASSGNTNAFNEFLKAGSWHGNTNVLFGYGRNSYTNTDANALNTAMTVGTKTLPVGYFNGLNPLLDSRTRVNENYYGIYDLSGNVSEWVNDPPRPGVPDARSVCGGSYGDQIQPLTVDRIVPPNACDAVGGFRPVTTFMPQTFTEVHVLYCFHSPQGTPPMARNRFGTQFERMRKEKAKPTDLTPASDIERIAQPRRDPGAESPTAEIGPDGQPPEATTEEPPGEPELEPTPETGPPGIIYPEEPDDEPEPPEPDDDFPPPSPGGEPEPPAPQPTTTYRLGVYSENPDSDVGIAIDVADVTGQAGGATSLERFYLYGKNVTLTAPPTEGNNTFQYWTRNGVPFSTSLTITIQMLSDLDLTAVYLMATPTIQHTLNVNATPADNVPIKISQRDNNGETDGETRFTRIYGDGDTVTVTAPEEADDETFLQWFRNSVPFSLNRNVTVTVLDDISLTAHYGRRPAPTERRLIVTSENPDSDVPITVNTPDNNDRDDGTTTFDRLYDYGETVVLTAPATANGNTFSHWLRDGSFVSDATDVSVTLLADTIMTAVYEIPTPDIKLIVHSDPQSDVPISIGTPDKNNATDGNTRFTRLYETPTSTTVSAPPDIADGSLVFKRWLLNSVPFSTNPDITIPLLTDTELTAVYRDKPAPTPTYDLVVNSDPDSGVTITVDTPDIFNNASGDTTFTRTYEEGAETRLTAPETAPNGKVFDRWLVDGQPYSVNRTINVAMYGAHTATAIYKDAVPLLRHVLTIESRNPDSSVVVSVDPVDVNNQQNGTTTFTRLFDHAEVVTLTARNPAIPGTDNTLKQWLLDGAPISTNITITVTILRDTTVTAVYGPEIPQNDVTLTVASQNPDSNVGITISEPDLNGDTHGATEFDRLYSYGTPVTATAPEIAPDGNTFQHWLLNGNLYTTDRSVNVNMLGDLTLTAVYDTPAIEHVLSVNSRNPDSGIDVQVSTPDNNNNQDGTTSFERFYGDGVDVTLTTPAMAPNGRDEFKRWERDGSPVTTNTTVALTLFSDITMTAIYGAPNTVNLIVRSENPDDGANITISAPDINGNTAGTTEFFRTYNPGELTTLTAEETTTAGTVFQQWLRNDVPYSTDRTVTLSLLSDTEMTAVYGPVPPEDRWLTVRSENPNAGVPIDVSLPDQRGQSDGDTAFIRRYEDGDTVSVSAPVTAGGNSFQQWILNGGTLTTNLDATVYMDQDHELIAVYGPPLQPDDRTLVVDSRNPPSGVPIEVSEPDNNGNSNGDTVFVRTYTYSDTIVLTAGTNDTTFLYWEMNGSRYTEDRTVTVEMLTDMHMTAVYGDVIPDVTLDVYARDSDTDSPIAGVTVSVAPADKDDQATGATTFQRIYEGGTTVTLTAPSTANDKEFQFWDRNGSPDSTNQTVSAELLTDTTLTAVYGEPLEEEELTLRVRSEGPDGTLSTIVTATPDNDANAGGSTTFERFYNTGTEITLNAPSSSNGYVFDHWERNGSTYSNSQTITLELFLNLTLTAVYKSPPPSASGL